MKIGITFCLCLVGALLQATAFADCDYPVSLVLDAGTPKLLTAAPTPGWMAVYFRNGQIVEPRLMDPETNYCKLVGISMQLPIPTQPVLYSPGHIETQGCDAKEDGGGRGLWIELGRDENYHHFMYCHAVSDLSNDLLSSILGGGISITIK